MSQGRGQHDPYWDTGPPSYQNGYVQNGFMAPHIRERMPNQAQPAPPLHWRNQQGPAVTGLAYTRHSMPPEHQKQPNGKPNHGSLPSRHMRQNPSQNEIDHLQSRIRNMLSNDSSPNQAVTEPNSPTSFRGRGRGALYYSPPLRRGAPPKFNGNRDGRPYSREGPYDNCEDISSYALGIVKSLEIPDDERQEKEDFCRHLEDIVQRIRPTAKVELFGSFANTFTIANSDIDCCVTDPNSTSNELQQSGLPEAIQAELDSIGFETTLLTLTRIPILKIFRPATNLDSLPANYSGPIYKYPLHCDVGWQNRLALHNTRLLATYSRLDPRVRELVLFVKYWTKTRGISRPRYGSLCSYGYVLMILYYLTHIVSPPVLPNLQTLPNRGAMSLEDLECEGCNIYFSRDANGWNTMNGDSVGELVKGFFNYFAFEWHFKNHVISIRSPNGMLTKEAKGWTTLAESTGSQSQTIKSRYLIAIEDPFEISHNVARTVNQQGRFDIRGEFIRAAKMLNTTHGRQQWLSDVCTERVLPERLPRPKRPDGDNAETVLDVPEVGKEGNGAGVRVLLPPVTALTGEIRGGDFGVV